MALETFLANTLHVTESPTVPARVQWTRHLRFTIPLLVIALAIAGYFMFRATTRVLGDPPIAATPVIDGDWVAVMQKPGQRSFRIRLSFRRVGTVSAARCSIRPATGRCMTSYSRAHAHVLHDARAAIRIVSSHHPVSGRSERRRNPIDGH